MVAMATTSISISDTTGSLLRLGSAFEIAATACALPRTERSRKRKKLSQMSPSTRQTCKNLPCFLACSSRPSLALIPLLLI